MFYRIEVKEKDGFYDAVGESVKKDIAELGLGKKVRDVKFICVYLVEGDIGEADVKRIAEDLLVDPVTQHYSFKGPVAREEGFKPVEVAYNPGVMDPVEESAKKAIRDLGIPDVKDFRTAKNT
jgi:phosphoribosylformylglycinamidine (FGAM) synthase PurS component